MQVAYCQICFKAAEAVSQWIGYAIAQSAWEGGQWFIGKGSDGKTREVRMLVKIGPKGLLREAEAITDQRAMQEGRNLIYQFLNGNPSPGAGTKFLSGSRNIYYLRGDAGSGIRVFFRNVGVNKYEILGFSTKQNESRVINLLLQYYP